MFLASKIFSSCLQDLRVHSPLKNLLNTLLSNRNNMIEPILIEAIDAKCIISFTYKGKKRRAEVYTLGVSKAGSLVCRCYEIPLSGFKLFLVDEMKHVTLENRKWFFARSGYNRNGDASMVEVLSQV